MMEVNSDSVSILTKSILETEVQLLKTRLKPQDTGRISTAIGVLEERIEELKLKGNKS
jgi:hypothetical protein